MVAPIAAAMLPGLAAWKVLNKDETADLAKFQKQPEIARAIDYFQKNIGSIKTAADLVKNPKLFQFALETFGLGEQVNAQAMMRQVLEQGVTDKGALANKLVDPRYRQMAAAFSFDTQGASSLSDPSWVAGMVAKYTTQKYETAVGDTAPDLRVAMYFKRTMPAVTSWFQVLGDTALFDVVKTTMGLPDGFSNLDVDRQADILEQKMPLKQATNAAQIDRTAQRYIAVSDATSSASAYSAMSPALQLLSQPMNYSPVSIDPGLMLALLQQQNH